MTKKTESAPAQAGAPKQSRFKSLVTKAGGAEGILSAVSSGAAKGAEMIRNRKAGVNQASEGVGFEAGARDDEKKDPKLLGMPQVMAYTLIFLVFALVLFGVFKMAAKK